MLKLETAKPGFPSEAYIAHLLALAVIKAVFVGEGTDYSTPGKSPGLRTGQAGVPTQDPPLPTQFCERGI